MTEATLNAGASIPRQALHVFSFLVLVGFVGIALQASATYIMFFFLFGALYSAATLAEVFSLWVLDREADVIRFSSFYYRESYRLAEVREIREEAVRWWPLMATGGSSRFIIAMEDGREFWQSCNVKGIAELLDGLVDVCRKTRTVEVENDERIVFGPPSA